MPRAPRSSFVPYIYTEAELRKLLQATSEICSVRQSLIEDYALRALLLTLYGSALRLGEAIALNGADVDLDQAVLTIRQTKFFKTRLVPTGHDLTLMLTDYRNQRDRRHPRSAEEAFFRLRNGARMNRPVVERTFRRLRTATGVRRVLNDVTGTPFPKLMHDLVLQPLGMQHSTYEQPLPGKLLAHAATPYRGDGTPVEGGAHVYPEQAAAGLWTTPSDLARLAIGVQRALSGTSAIVLPLGTAHAMLAPMYNQQAIGFVVGGSTAQKYFTHGGANAGYQCLLVSYQNGDGAVVMTNSDNGHEVASEILRTVAHEYRWPDFAPAERTLNAIEPSSFDRYAGAYRLKSGETVTFWRDDTQFKSRVSGQGAVEIFPTSEHEYFVKVVDARWEFSSDANEAGTSVTLYQYGQQLAANRLNGAEGQTALGASLAIEKRFREQRAVPGSEAALRRLIEGLANADPHYDEMSPALAQITREQLPALQKSIVGFGPLRSVSFKAVGPGGADIYEVMFEHAVREFRLLLESDGRVHFAQFSP